MKKKILIIEDNLLTSDMISLRLSESGYDVVPAYDGKAGLAKIKELRPDLVILDVRMPEMDGFEVCRLAKNDPDIRKIPIIFLTTSSQKADFNKAKEAGADGYMTKPYEGKGLVSEINKFFKRL